LVHAAAAAAAARHCSEHAGCNTILFVANKVPPKLLYILFHDAQSENKKNKGNTNSLQSDAAQKIT